MNLSFKCTTHNACALAFCLEMTIELACDWSCCVVHFYVYLFGWVEDFVDIIVSQQGLILIPTIVLLSSCHPGFQWSKHCMSDN